jgi:hypothetical protein
MNPELIYPRYIRTLFEPGRLRHLLASSLNTLDVVPEPDFHRDRTIKIVDSIEDQAMRALSDVTLDGDIRQD